MSSNNDEPYVLGWEVDHLVDEDFDASLVKFPTWENSINLIPRKSVKFPEKIFFEANFRTLDKTDFPYNSVRWPIMSERMLDALKSAGEFPRREIPVIMLDDTVRSRERFDEFGAPKPSASRGGFIAVELGATPALFDAEQSRFDADELFPRDVGVIHKLVLRRPPGGFPPLFRIAEYPTILFLSAEAQHKLEDAGIKGATYTPVSEYES
jgi:hypothetical protein